MAMMKPDLRINIPGSTAPELPYSQRPQAAGADLSRMDKVGWQSGLGSATADGSSRSSSDRP
jgi:hypothetical protein